MKPKNSRKTTKPQKQNQPNEETTTTPEEFSFAITRVAVSQICKSFGFKGAQSSALETLTLITTKYLQELAQLASSYSHSSCRTESNAFDVINALHDFNLLEGFVGASKIEGNNCLLSSRVLKELAGFVKYSDETPFAKPVPRVQKTKLLSKGLVPCSEKEMMKKKNLHIPKWLPALPDLSGGVCEKKRSLWENSGAVEGKGEVGGELSVRKESLGGDLVRERRKVRFKIGLKENMMSNGICKGAGNDEEDKRMRKRKRY
ncbi:transcription initiation factor TFIID subunit 8-like [Mangifera indica]|uniref:transcription initiation factor TFIID subunit 8-like n=1 Tax=Mangifera indica TaxID=29780 RepID=UPI001CFA0645|nr:transcription initiation factor TFIID subunit 8-like [Mangifera indica]